VSGASPSPIALEKARQAFAKVIKAPVAYHIWTELITSTVRDGDLQAALPILNRDPGLTVKLLAVANSSAFAGMGEVTDLTEALLRLGTMETLRIVAALVFRDVTNEGLPLWSLNQEQFLNLSLATGSLMARHAARADLPPATAQSLGLLRGLGHWFLQQAFLETGATPPAPYTGPYLASAPWEQEHFGVTHADYAAQVFAENGLPAALVEPLRQYLAPEPGPWRRAATLLRLATAFAARQVLPHRTPSLPDQTADLALLELTPEDFTGGTTPALPLPE
jgi:HD-like signal output (HDOD) protein